MDPSADIPENAEYSSGLEQGCHEQESAAIPQTGAILGDLGTLPLASLQKVLKKSVSELSVVLLHLCWQLGSTMSAVNPIFMASPLHKGLEESLF